MQHDAEAFRGKLESGRKGFGELWETVRGQVESVVELVEFFFLRCHFSSTAFVV